jgi:3-methylfumaryl-CoA hydratase
MCIAGLVNPYMDHILHICILAANPLPMTDPTDRDAFPATTRRHIVTDDFPRRIAAMLGLTDSVWDAGTPLPFGWHFPILGAETVRSQLRADGFPGLGVPMPDLPGKRLVAAGRKVDHARALQIGQEIERVSAIASVTPKMTSQGAITIVTIEHALRDARDAALILSEKQTFILLDMPYVATEPAAPKPAYAIEKTITPDDTMLFQFSALSFNSHKIHLDRDYARSVEGYPDLVVNGGLTTLLMTEFARVNLRITPKQLSVRNSAPLFCNQPVHLARIERDGRRFILAHDDHGRVAAEMEYETDDL